MKTVAKTASVAKINFTKPHNSFTNPSIISQAQTVCQSFLNDKIIHKIKNPPIPHDIQKDVSK